MEYARDLAIQMQAEGKGKVLDQFANQDNPRSHYETTGPEIWRDTDGPYHALCQRDGHDRHDHGRGPLLKECNAAVQIIGAQPAEGSQIPGIRKWSDAYLPRIYDPSGVDRLEYVTQSDAEAMTRRLAAEEGISCGPSAAGACLIALRIAAEVEDATIVFVVCDRGDRYLSTGLFGV